MYVYTYALIGRIVSIHGGLLLLSYGNSAYQSQVLRDRNELSRFLFAITQPKRTK